MCQALQVGSGQLMKFVSYSPQDARGPKHLHASNTIFFVSPLLITEKFGKIVFDGFRLPGTFQTLLRGFFPLEGYSPPPYHHFSKKPLAEMGGTPPPPP